MTTLERMEDLKKLLDAYVQNEITEDEFYTRVQKLASHDPEAFSQLREWISTMLEEEGQS